MSRKRGYPSKFCPSVQEQREINVLIRIVETDQLKICQLKDIMMHECNNDPVSLKTLKMTNSGCTSRLNYKENGILKPITVVATSSDVNDLMSKMTSGTRIPRPKILYQLTPNTMRRKTELRNLQRQKNSIENVDCARKIVFNDHGENSEKELLHDQQFTMNQPKFYANKQEQLQFQPFVKIARLEYPSRIAKIELSSNAIPKFEAAEQLPKIGCMGLIKSEPQRDEVKSLVEIASELLKHITSEDLSNLTKSTSTSVCFHESTTDGQLSSENEAEIPADVLNNVVLNQNQGIADVIEEALPHEDIPNSGGTVLDSGNLNQFSTTDGNLELQKDEICPQVEISVISTDVSNSGVLVLDINKEDLPSGNILNSKRTVSEPENLNHFTVSDGALGLQKDKVNFQGETDLISTDDACSSGVLPAVVNKKKLPLENVCNSKDTKAKAGHDYKFHKTDETLLPRHDKIDAPARSARKSTSNISNGDGALESNMSDDQEMDEELQSLAFYAQQTSEDQEFFCKPSTSRDTNDSMDKLKEENERLRKERQELQAKIKTAERDFKDLKKKYSKKTYEGWLDDERFIVKSDGMIEITEKFSITKKDLQAIVSAEDMKERCNSIVALFWDVETRHKLYRNKKRNQHGRNITTEEYDEIINILSKITEHRMMKKDSVIVAWDAYLPEWIAAKLNSDRNKWLTKLGQNKHIKPKKKESKI